MMENKDAGPVGFDPGGGEMPILGGGITPSQWLRSIASAIDASLSRPRGLQDTRPLRLCGYCNEWSRKPCGDGCRWSFSDPTFEVLEARECGNRTQSSDSDRNPEGRDAEERLGAEHESAGRQASPKPVDQGAPS